MVVAERVFNYEGEHLRINKMVLDGALGLKEERSAFQNVLSHLSLEENISLLCFHY